jgi:hypothetical protein
MEEDYTILTFSLMVLGFFIVFVISTYILIRNILNDKKDVLEFLEPFEEKDDDTDVWNGYKECPDRVKYDIIGYIAIAMYILLVIVIFFVIL